MELLPLNCCQKSDQESNDPTELSWHVLHRGYLNCSYNTSTFWIACMTITYVSNLQAAVRLAQ